MFGYTTAMMNSLLIVSEAHEALHLLLFILNKELLSPWLNGLINPDKLKQFHRKVIDLTILDLFQICL